MVKRPGNVVDAIYQTLHERIINGVYPPGLKMSQLELAEDLKVSRTPLREALNRLQSNRLVVGNSNRGVEVAAVRPEETEQWYALRLMVEPTVIAGICRDLSKEDLATMRGALDDMDRSRERTKDYQKAHHRFHAVALQHYPNVIHEMIESIYQQIMRHQRAYFSRPRAAEDFIDVDRLFLDALCEGDAASARHLLEFHLIDAALGLLYDVDHDYVPKSLLMVARGLGIEIECDDAEVPKRPARVTWTARESVVLPALRTSNLEFVVPSTARPKGKPTVTKGR